MVLWHLFAEVDYFFRASSSHFIVVNRKLWSNHAWIEMVEICNQLNINLSTELNEKKITIIRLFHSYFVTWCSLYEWCISLYILKIFLFSECTFYRRYSPAMYNFTMKKSFIILYFFCFFSSLWVKIIFGAQQNILSHSWDCNSDSYQFRYINSNMSRCTKFVMKPYIKPNKKQAHEHIRWAYCCVHM